jgi:DNA-binding NarL/FixJ family response regulator
MSDDRLGGGAVEGGRNTDGPLRVLLADNHTLFRRGLAIALDAHDDIETVAWVPNDDEVPELARELRPDVVVMGARVPSEEAGTSIDRMRAISPAPKVVVASMLGDPATMRAFLKLGASGCVPKSSPTAVLVAAIRAAGGLGGEASWVPLTEDMLGAEDFGEDGADGRA